MGKGRRGSPSARPPGADACQMSSAAIRVSRLRLVPLRLTAACRRLRRHSAVEAVCGRSVAFAVAADALLGRFGAHLAPPVQSRAPEIRKLLAAGRCSSPALGIVTAAKDHRTAIVRNTL